MIEEELKEIPILKLENGKLLYMTVPNDREKIMVVNTFSSNPIATRMMINSFFKICQTVKIEDPKEKVFKDEGI